MAIAAIAASSSRVSTVPVGLCGVFSRIIRVRRADRGGQPSASRAHRPSASGRSGTETWRAPDIATTAGYES